jgi:NAD(P)-dependent dehydrogenase (short-subunit alcohol dehydrogenase family)
VQAGVDVRHLEQTDQQSIVDCVRGVVETYGRLDALVNNAGIAYSGFTLELNDLDVIRANMEVNFFGVIALTKAALPHLRATRGRVITISSLRGVIGQPFNEAYSAAKHAIEGFMEALAPVVAQVGVDISLIEPAAVMDTAFVPNAVVAGLNPQVMIEKAGPYAPAFAAYREWVRTRAAEGSQLANDVAAVVIDALSVQRPAFRIQTSAAVRSMVAQQLADPSGEAIQLMTRSCVTPAGSDSVPVA